MEAKAEIVAVVQNAFGCEPEGTTDPVHVYVNVDCKKNLSSYVSFKPFDARSRKDATIITVVRDGIKWQGTIEELINKLTQ